MNRYDKHLLKLENSLPHIDVQELKQWQKEGRSFLLVDVRQPEEFLHGHISGSINIPRPKIECEIESRMAAPDQVVVVHCGGRGRSQLVCASLRAMGLNGLVLKGGYQAWQLE
jgi:rhodanese-related sulfurtransferase